MMQKTTLGALIALGLISTISLVATSAYAETACRRDCQAPTMGVLDNGKVVVSGGFKINGNTYDVADFSQSIPTTNLNVGNTVQIQLLVNENDGYKGLSHVSLGIGHYPDLRHQVDTAVISWDQKFDGTKSVTVLDQNGVLSGAHVSSVALDEFNTMLIFSFNVIRPLDTSSLKVNMWDQNGSERVNYFIDALNAS